MWKQIAGFALCGAALAVLGAAVGRGAAFGGDTFVVYTGTYDLAGSGPSRWSPYTWAAVCGALAGAVAGVVLWLANFRLSGSRGGMMARVVFAGTAGSALGLAPALVLVATAFNGEPVVDVHPLVVYAVSAVCAYVFALSAVYGVLTLARDVAARQTVRRLAVMLPLGAVVATAAGVGVASLQEFDNGVPTWITVIFVVLSIVAGSFVAGRAWALCAYTS